MAALTLGLLVGRAGYVAHDDLPWQFLSPWWYRFKLREEGRLAIFALNFVLPVLTPLAATALTALAIGVAVVNTAWRIYGSGSSPLQFLLFCAVLAFNPSFGELLWWPHTLAWPFVFVALVSSLWHLPLDRRRLLVDFVVIGATFATYQPFALQFAVATLLSILAARGRVPGAQRDDLATTLRAMLRQSVAALAAMALAGGTAVAVVLAFARNPSLDGGDWRELQPATSGLAGRIGVVVGHLRWHLERLGDWGALPLDGITIGHAPLLLGLLGYGAVLLRALRARPASWTALLVCLALPALLLAVYAIPALTLLYYPFRGLAPSWVVLAFLVAELAPPRGSVPGACLAGLVLLVALVVTSGNLVAETQRAASESSGLAARIARSWTIVGAEQPPVVVLSGVGSRLQPTDVSALTTAALLEFRHGLKQRVVAAGPWCRTGREQPAVFLPGGIEAPEPDDLCVRRGPPSAFERLRYPTQVQGGPP